MIAVKKGDTVKLKDGQMMVVRGCFMSTTGIVVTMRPLKATGVVDYNIPIEEVVEVVGAAQG